ncbi:hypothetical protein GWK47_009528 [Chionoecetes opilio]|uniref:Uncharacterized protein n=1 Tax=Chionoecetes opilio TaxID=41210 RepID=A0A8J5CNK0_CHIOP|nr:hypothetical protein GWK47_009528 [Chionoecetes opilio]
MQVTTGFFRLLPDVITSHTPPPSPLRRAHSCLSFFHEKATPDSPNSPGSEAETEAGLGHIHEAPGQVQSDAPTPASLPTLSWVLPRRPAGHPGEEARRRGREEPEAEERRRLWRHVGGDLRKMADQFEVDRSPVSTRGSAHVALPTSVPAILGKCLAGSLLCLVWWRLYHGAR